jgi:hypothetical protein
MSVTADVAADAEVLLLIKIMMTLLAVPVSPHQQQSLQHLLLHWSPSLLLPPRQQLLVMRTKDTCWLNTNKMMTRWCGALMDNRCNIYMEEKDTYYLPDTILLFLPDTILLFNQLIIWPAQSGNY